MEIKEGTITQTHAIPLPEVILSSEFDSMSYRFQEFIEKIHSGKYSREDMVDIYLEEEYHNHPIPEFEFGPVAGGVSNTWRYWFNFVEPRINPRCDYDYPVMWIRPGIELELPQYHPRIKKLDSGLRITKNETEINLNDFSTRVWILLYPTGLVSIKARMYFKSKSYLNTDQINALVKLIGDLRVPASNIASVQSLSQKCRILDNDFQWENRKESEFDHPIEVIQNWMESIGVDVTVESSPPKNVFDKSKWYDRINIKSEENIKPIVTPSSPSLFSSIKRDLLSTIYGLSDSPTGLRDFSDLPTYPVLYAYHAKNIEKKYVMNIFKNPKKRYDSYFIDNHSSRSLGKYKSDEIYITTFGTFIYTNAFADADFNTKRNRRLELINAIYTGVDLGIFMKQMESEIIQYIQSVDNELIEGTLTGVPMDIETIGKLHDLILFTRNLGSLRKRVYDEIRPDDVETRIDSDLEATIRGLANHDSEFRQALKNSPFSLGLSFGLDL